MGKILHGRATTTPYIRKLIQESKDSIAALAKRYGVNPKTVAKWRKRKHTQDLPTGPKKARSSSLSVAQEAAALQEAYPPLP